MTIEELLIYGKKNCHSDYAKILLGDLLQKNPLELLLYLSEHVPDEIAQKYKEEVEAIKNNKPLQYVMGKVNFYGNEFYINENVLIPRFETEELVENTIKYIEKNFAGEVSILDLGCGSGVIGLTLKNKIPTAKVTLVDISKEALEVSKINSNKLNLEATFINSDMLNNVNDKYDVIISNPPYIRNNEEIETIVKENEPHLALYGGEDGLEYYKKILKNVSQNLSAKYLIAFEIGKDQAKSISDIANKYLENINIIIKKDLQERDRMLFIFPKN
ncbi:MAG: peptide chain release factor N(5)-glutamine methyltransferase [Bacilli bacterium]|nr:peptide chain release factor N(5)-glutamine methyltransferase [Bacilli bacterium]